MKSFLVSAPLLAKWINKELGELPEDALCTLLRESGFSPVLSASEVEKEYQLLEHRPPLVRVIRKRDNAEGLMLYVDQPRVYFKFEVGLPE